jgi:UDP-N-acetylglucosamine 2-epimerase (non-hydrolysing)
MTGKKVAIVCGTRPEAIKLFPVHLELLHQGFDVCFISTGQQEQLLKETFQSLGMVPDIELGLMTNNQSPGLFLASAISALTATLIEISADFIIVQGDTLSAFAGAMSGYLSKVPVGHVEAGLRSHDLHSPWPEEGIRRSIDSISSILWAPTSDDFIKTEPDQILEVTGNTVVDALRLIATDANNGNSPEDKILVTLHRRESFGPVMTNAIKELIKLSHVIQHRIIFVQHPNPNVAISAKDAELDGSRIEVISPVPYIDFIKELQTCKLLITDSGGLQEESTVLGIPTIILREKTERTAAVIEGMSKLSPPDGKQLIEDSLIFLNRDQPKSDKSENFGDGFASLRIVKSVMDFLS